jgi:hypothetical protein
VTPQLQLAAPSGGGCREAESFLRRNGGDAPEHTVAAVPPDALLSRTAPADLPAAHAAHDQSLSHALCARTVEQVRERFLIVEQRAVELRVLARRAA